VIVAPGPIYLKDIATVFFDMKEETTLSRVNGKEAISVALVNDAQVNLLELSDRTKQRIEALNQEFQAQEIELVVQSNSADEIEKNIDQVVELAISGALLAIAVLWFFLRNIHLVFFIALSMPISILAAFNLFYYYDISINSLTLIGMALAIGMLLDNSIVVLENIYRLFTHGKSAEVAVTQGTREVWKSILAATLTTITVFLPFLFSDEVFIKLIGEHIGISIIATLVFSLTVALLLIPMVMMFNAEMKGKKYLLCMAAMILPFLFFPINLPIQPTVNTFVIYVGLATLSIYQLFDTVKRLRS
jgi:multidrug efflux pump subunit AcrB